MILMPIRAATMYNMPSKIRVFLMNKAIFSPLFYRMTAALGLFCLLAALSQAHAFWWLFNDDDNDNHAPVVEAQRHGYDNDEFPPIPTEFAKIAVLLPLNGAHANATQAIREGIITEYYAHQAQNHSTPPDIRFYDTQNDKNVLATYQQAVHDGAQLIIGPLTKPGIETLLQAQAIAVPTLALNYLSRDTGTPSYLFQFGLAPEDEITQVAALAAAQGHEDALIIVENSAWGKRIGNAFIQAWENNNGRIVDDLMLSPQIRELSEPIQHLLHIQPNTRPMRKNMDFRLTAPDPRDVDPEHFRRYDFDFIFLAVPRNTAQQIPPMLKFLYASDIPVYAPANIYNGVPNPMTGNDLNGVSFCDAPWVVNPQRRAPGSNYAATLLANGATQMEPRFFALGLDAYRLAVNLASVRPRYFSDQGATGMLQVNRARQIVRTPQCAIFRNGLPRPLPPLSEIRSITRQNEYDDRYEDRYDRDD